MLASSVRVGTSEPPAIALLRHLLFPGSVMVSLVIAMALFSQPITQPYVVLFVLAFALSWQILGDAKFRELRPLSQMQFFLPQVLLAWAKVLAVLLFIGFAAKASSSYSRAVIIAWLVMTPALYVISHSLAHRLLCRWNRHGRIVRTHIIVGHNSTAREFAARLENEASLGTFIGYFDDCDDPHQVSARRLLGDLDDLPEYVRRNSIDVIHIALPLNEHPRLQRTLQALRDSTVSIYFLLDLPANGHGQTRIVEMAGTPLLAYFETPYCGLPGAAKRVIDLTFACIVLAIIWPVLIAIAAFVRFDSPGPVIFKQRRYGLNGEEIAVYKFRTMTVCEDGEQIVQARREDPRVTRIGKFLRRTSLDELPQLFCVIAGSMSLVGPRPHAVAQNEQYRRLIDGYMLRHKVQPGITGWAQVNGFRGETNTVEQMRMRVAYDLEYLRRWSPWVDIAILWRTALLVLRDRNAY
jgi:putative colanic acid biosynthesis UDP-glucose lipid carrier transferase